MKMITKTCLPLILFFGISHVTFADEGDPSASTINQASADDAAAKQAQEEMQRAEQAKKEEEEKRLLAEKKAEEERKAEESKQLAAKKAEEDRQAEEARLIAANKAEENRRIEAVRQLAAQRAEERKNDEARKAEVDRRLAEAKARFQARREVVISERAKVSSQIEPAIKPTQETVITTRSNNLPLQPQTKTVIVEQAPKVVVVEPRRVYPPHATVTTTIIKPVPVTEKIVTLTQTKLDEQRFRERELKERELRLRELELRNREARLSEKERNFQEHLWYERSLRKREWQDAVTRDQELRYLMWREQFIQPYSWSDRGRICRYVTYYNKGVKVNKRVTICKWRNGVYTCYHPTRYYIYPVTKIVCTPIRRSVVIIH